jgi:hypothetical protein
MQENRCQLCKNLCTRKLFNCIFVKQDAGIERVAVVHVTCSFVPFAEFIQYTVSTML